MVVVEVYKKSLQYKYKSTLISKATFFTLFCNTFALILPFILAYRSKGLWLKHDIYYEQPSVKFKGEFIFVGITDHFTNPLICTTFPFLYQRTNNYDKCSLVKVKENDFNFDNKIDELFFEISTELPKNEKLLFINLIIPLDYKLHSVCLMHMQSAVIFQHTLDYLANTVHVRGDLQVTQSNPLICHKYHKEVYYNYSLIKNPSDLESYRIENVIDEYWKRNISTQLTNMYINSHIGEQETFVLNLHVRFVENQIYYKPGLWQVMKWAWIQYFSLYIVFSYIICKIKNYVYENRLVLFYKHIPK